MKRFFYLFFTSFTLFYAELHESDNALQEYLLNPTAEERSLEAAGTEKTFRLNFQQQYGIYLIFYDYSGTVLYLQFRRDKFDYKPLKKVSTLIQGHTYRVTLKNLRQTQTVPPKYKPVQEKGVIGKILVGDFVSATEAVLDDLRY